MLWYAKRFFWYLLNKPKALFDLLWCKMAPVLPDKLFIKVHFWLNLNYRLDLKNPKSYNEKLQWLKLNNHHDEYTHLVDKIEAKEYVSRIIGDEYIIPTLGIWNSVEDISWGTLPQKFVIKATSDSGSVIVCKDKSKLNIEKSSKILSKLGNRDYTIISKEYPYKKVPHRFIAEKYLEDESGYELKDYKFFCFDGVVRFLFVATGRQSHDTRFDFFDTSFNHLPVINGHPNADVCPVKPLNFDKMIEIASKLSQGFPHVRIDLYNVSGKIYFGEFTFFHWSGMVPFIPIEWDYRFGEYISLPSKQTLNV